MRCSRASNPRPPAVAAGLACAALLAGCSGSPSGTTEPPTVPASPPTSAAPPSDPPATSTTTGTTGTTGIPPSSPTPRPTGTPASAKVLVDGLPLPWSMAPLPDGDVLVSLRDEARVVRLDPAAGTEQEVPTTSSDGTFAGAEPRGEGGLLGLALSPDFARDRYVYAYVSREDDNVVVRARYEDGRLGEPETVLGGIPVGSTHNGGRLAFGPDGYLYVTTGDTREASLAQDPGSLAGKILRITPDGEPAPGNPTPGSPVWSLGHRNVQGIGWDAAGRLYASEFGLDTWDELNLIRPGGNYGWPVVEGPGGETAEEQGFVEPLVWWRPSEASPSGAAVTGDAVYVSALRGQRLWRVPLVAGSGDGPVGTPEDYLVGDFGRLRDVQVAPGGDALWVLTNRGDGDDQLLAVPLR